MTEQGFIPLTGQLGIAGTSYRLQLGLINNKWASRILKGKDVIDSYVFKDTELAAEREYPNQNYLVGWVLRTVMIPNINPHQIMKTSQALVKQALQRKQEKKAKVPIAETKEVELEKVPESEIKRPSKGPGWVKQEGEKTQEEMLEEQRKAFKERVAAERAEEEKVSAPTMKTKRQLPKIPGAPLKEEVSVETPSEKVAEEISVETPSEEIAEEISNFCPYCGKDIDFKFCPFCGKPLPHEH